MAKKVFIILLTAMILASSLVPAVVYAGDSIVDRDPDSVLEGNVWDDEDVEPEELWGDVKEDNGMLTKLFIWLVQEIMHGLNAFLGLHDPVTLFFNISPEVIYSDYALDEEGEQKRADRLERHLYIDPDEGFLFMFSDNEKNVILGVMNTFEKVLQIPYVLAVAIVGFLIFIKGGGSDDRSVGKILLMGILIYPILLKFFPYLFEPIFWVNDALVRAVGSVLMNPNFVNAGKSILTRPFVTALIDSGTGLNSLGALLGTVILFFITAILNFQYFVRRFMLAILIMMFPIVAFLQIFPGTRGTFRMWWSEFMANLFLQPAHAIVYTLFIGYVYNASLPFVPMVAMLMTLSTISTFVRNLMGCKPGSGVSGMVGGMMGIGAIMGAARIGRQTFQGISNIGKSSDFNTETGFTGTGSSISPGTTTGGVDHGVAAAGAAGVGADIVSEEGVDEGSEVGLGEMGGPDDSPPTGVGGVGEEGTTLGDREARELSTTGQRAWGFRPSNEDPNWKATVLRGVGKAAAGGAIFVGAMAGGGAMGSAGLGVGALAASKGVGLAVGGADRVAGVYNNFRARNEIINDTMKRRGMNRQDATIFAATGVQATPEEVKMDDELNRQYRNFRYQNFSSIATSAGNLGEKGRKVKDTIFPSENGMPQSEIEGVRLEAAQERERYMEQNPSAGMVDVNQHILDNVIRPSVETYNAEHTPYEPFKDMEGQQMTMDDYMAPRQLTTDDFVNNIDDVLGIDPYGPDEGIVGSSGSTFGGNQDGGFVGPNPTPPNPTPPNLNSNVPPVEDSTGSEGTGGGSVTPPNPMPPNNINNVTSSKDIPNLKENETQEHPKGYTDEDGNRIF